MPARVSTGDRDAVLQDRYGGARPFRHCYNDAAAAKDAATASACCRYATHTVTSAAEYSAHTESAEGARAAEGKL